jgi:hypothetical protein
MPRFLPGFDLPADDIAAPGLGRRTPEVRDNQSAGEPFKLAPSIFAAGTDAADAAAAGSR